MSNNLSYTLSDFSPNVLIISKNIFSILEYLFYFKISFIIIENFS